MVDRFVWKLDWNLLRSYIVIVEYKSISRAADHLGLRQPSVSLALKRLETIVGQKLIERGPSQFRVTAAGEVLYWECKAIFSRVESLPDALGAAQDTLKGHITLSMTSHVVSSHFDKTLENFHKMHPQVTFSISVERSTSVLQRVEQGQSTLGVCLLSKMPKKAHAHILFRERFGLYCGKRHPLFYKENCNLDDLDGSNSVTFQTELDDGPLSEVNKLRSIAKLNMRHTGGSFNLPELTRMIKAGLGIGALPMHIAEQDVRAGELKQLPPFDNLPIVDVYLIYSQKRKTSRTERAFVDVFEKLINSTPIEERSYYTLEPD